METNTELLNRIEAHIKGRLAVAESRAASSELYEGKKIAYNSLLGFVHSLRTELAVCPACMSDREIMHKMIDKICDAQKQPHEEETDPTRATYSEMDSNGNVRRIFVRAYAITNTSANGKD